MGLRESLNRLAGHFEASEGDTPEVKEYKQVMQEGFARMDADVLALEKTVKGEDHAES